MAKRPGNSGNFFIWLSGLGLSVSLLFIAGLLALIISESINYFWAKDIYKFTMDNGTEYLGQIFSEEDIEEEPVRYQLKIGNRDIFSSDFVWVSKSEIVKRTSPEDAVMLERLEYGNFYGYLDGIIVNGDKISIKRKYIYDQFQSYLDTTSNIRSEIDELDNEVLSGINYEIEQLRIEKKEIEYEADETLTQNQKKEISEINRSIQEKKDQYASGKEKLDSLRTQAERFAAIFKTVNDREVNIPMLQIVRAVKPNEMDVNQKLTHVVKKFREFIFAYPRESNTEGGVFPAIFGTVMMVIIMSIAVVPLGVVVALYLSEYAPHNKSTNAIRITIYNLAGVPSIVFGVFGLGFFIYFLGGSIDQLFYPEKLPNPTWGTGNILWASLTLAFLTLPVVTISTEEALFTIPKSVREASFALGGNKWQTIKKIIVPAATPGILTGLILSVARASGAVAPLMITGVVKYAPNLPLDGNFPFIHLDRKFMHLGFHIYDVGFQSPNVEAAMPMVYMTALLLIFIVVLLNLSAIILRARLRKKYQGSIF